MRFLSSIGLALLLATVCGCGKEQPTLSGGKPVGHWVRTLQDPIPKMRKQAAFKLGNVGTSDPVALPALIGALKDRDAGVRREAVLAALDTAVVLKALRTGTHHQES